MSVLSDDFDLDKAVRTLRYLQRQVIDAFINPHCRMFWENNRRTGSLYSLEDKGLLNVDERWRNGQFRGYWLTLTDHGKQVWEEL